MEEIIKTKALFSSRKSKILLLPIFLIVFIGGIIIINWYNIEEALAPPPVTIRLDPIKDFKIIEDVPYKEKESIIQYLNGYQNGWLYIAQHNSATIDYNGEGLTMGATTLCGSQKPYREGFRRGENDAGKKLQELVEIARKKFNE